MDDPTGATPFTVVVNDEEQYSVWDTGQPVPAGWHEIGFTGTRQECLEHIGRIWTDITPLSVRRRLAALRGPGEEQR
ncbi:MbtH family protein [Nonomuraea sp. PA05]|uniref:MbtH family protein n=1 Tax=Nonomuraea sp. PA05 TaxID=2604466 RepID=UPI0011D77AE3|nr:MbtH family protein [Nonomuraea sp. PA05]TYB55403.1 MbtH family protein [Nonomuraea sp. PA05]